MLPVYSCYLPEYEGLPVDEVLPDMVALLYETRIPLVVPVSRLYNIVVFHWLWS